MRTVALSTHQNRAVCPPYPLLQRRTYDMSRTPSATIRTLTDVGKTDKEIIPFMRRFVWNISLFVFRKPQPTASSLRLEVTNRQQNARFWWIKAVYLYIFDIKPHFDKSNWQNLRIFLDTIVGSSKKMYNFVAVSTGECLLGMTLSLVLQHISPVRTITNLSLLTIL